MIGMRRANGYVLYKKELEDTILADLDNQRLKKWLVE